MENRNSDRAESEKNQQNKEDIGSTTSSRRSLLRGGGLAGLGLLMAQGRTAMACDGTPTPAQTSGPFYPVESRDDEDADLTQIGDNENQALGEPILVTGRVLDEDCEPIADALVEIWQANTHGRYDHPEDTNPAPHDPNFQYWGRTTTDEDGAYSFKTILPGLYPGRTRHIHYRIVARGYRSLTTQLYFAGDPNNMRDGVYRRLSPSQRDLVTTTLEMDDDLGLRTGDFPIVLSAARNPFRRQGEGTTGEASDSQESEILTPEL